MIKLIKPKLRSRKNKLFFVLAVLLSLFLFKLAPYITPSEPLLLSVPFSTAVYDREFKLMRLKLADDDSYRLYASLDNITDVFRKSVLLYEDRYFYYHTGFNPLSLVRGVASLFKKDTRALGGSTITMQLARIRYSLHTKTIFGKFQQILFALYLEFRYTKDEILEAYFNLAPYGHNIYGVAAASLIYIGERAEELSLIDALTLAVIPQNPSARRISNQHGIELALTARKLLFERWIKLYPDDARYSSLIALPFTASTPAELPDTAPHFVNHLVYDKRLRGDIHSTINPQLQRMMQTHFDAYIRNNRRIGIFNAAALLINHKTMDIEAYIGSGDFYDRSIQGEVDGVSSKRTAASTLKPFIYALAIDQGLIHPKSMLKDSFKRFGAYSPENSDRGFMGPLFAQEALLHSRNIPAVDLLNRLDNNSFYQLLKTAEVSNLNTAEYYGSALALGSFETTMLEIASLYLTLARFGETGCINYQTDKRCKPKNIKLFSAEAAYLTMMMLDENPKPLNYNKIGHLYWKTGTSFAYKDGWCVGIMGDHILAVWVGNFNGDGNPNFNGRIGAGGLFFAIAGNLSTIDGREFANITPPKILNVQNVDICSPTGDLAGNFCPKIEQGLFIPGVSPIKVSDVHRQIAIDKATGLRACRYDPKSSELKIYEFWSTDLLALFEKAGIHKLTPPPYLAGCDLNSIAESGVAPMIIIPAHNTIYNITKDRDARDTIPFKATADSNVGKLFWFLDNKLVASVKPREIYYFKPDSVGRHKLTVADDAGRSSTIDFEIEVESGIQR